MRLIVKPQSQGASNGCGTTALSMAMEYWRPGARENERRRIDAAVRPFDWFTAPGDLIRYARQNGFQASLLADAQFNDLFGLLDRSIPVIVVVNSGQSLHYMLAVGYDTDPLQLHFADPASGGILTLEPSDFDAMWQDLTLLGLPTCVNRLLIAIAPPRKLKLAELLPIRPLESAGAVLLAALAVKDIAIGLHRKDPARLLGGGIEAISSLPGALGNLLAGLGSWGRKRARNSLTWLAALVLSAIGWSFQLLGMPFSWGGQAAGGALAWISQRRQTENDVLAREESG